MLFRTGMRRISSGDYEGCYLRATFGVRVMHLQAGYWTVTAEISDKPRFTDRSIVACGQLHAEVSRVFPELAEVIRWHLATDGIPLHYIANASYWHGMHHGKVSRREYDPDPKATFVKHVIALEGEDPASWISHPWPEVNEILRSRESALRAAYKADCLDRLDALREATGATPTRE